MKSRSAKPDLAYIHRLFAKSYQHLKGRPRPQVMSRELSELLRLRALHGRAWYVAMYEDWQRAQMQGTVTNATPCSLEVSRWSSGLAFLRILCLPAAKKAVDEIVASMEGDLAEGEWTRKEKAAYVAWQTTLATWMVVLRAVNYVMRCFTGRMKIG